MAGPSASAQLGVRLTSIRELPERVAALQGAAADRARRLLVVRTARAVTDPPVALEPWLERTFGSVEAVREQVVIKVDNLVTGEATLFAPLRSLRPVDPHGTADDLEAEVARAGSDPFCSPETGTPANRFGRVRGRRMITGANAAAADAHHAVIVFDEHDPLAFDTELVVDLLATGREWAERAMADDPFAANYLLIWNCLWRAGGSIVHGHAQALLGAGRHYARLERFRHDMATYRSSTGAHLVDDLTAVHADLGLAVGDEVTTLAHLTPAKERELLIVGRPGMDERDPAFAGAVADALIAYRDPIGVQSFNLALWRPPLDSNEGWEEMPPIVRLVDRGDLHQRPSDIGAMELYGTPIVASDPYDVIAALG